MILKNGIISEKEWNLSINWFMIIINNMNICNLYKIIFLKIKKIKLSIKKNSMKFVIISKKTIKRWIIIMIVNFVNILLLKLIKRHFKKFPIFMIIIELILINNK